MKHHAESQDSGWERSAAPGQAVSQLCLLLTKEVLFSGWRELPLRLYEVVEALPLEVPSLPSPLPLLGRNPGPGISLGCEMAQNTAGWKGACLLAVSSIFAVQSCILQGRLCLSHFLFISFWVCMFISVYVNICVCECMHIPVTVRIVSPHLCPSLSETIYMHQANCQ